MLPSFRWNMARWPMRDSHILDECSPREQSEHIGRASATARYAERTMTTMILIAQTRGLSHAYPLHTSITARPPQPERSAKLFRLADGQSVRIGERLAVAQVFGRWSPTRNEPTDAVSCDGATGHCGVVRVLTPRGFGTVAAGNALRAGRARISAYRKSAKAFCTE